MSVSLKLDSRLPCSRVARLLKMINLAHENARTALRLRRDSDEKNRRTNKHIG